MKTVLIIGARGFIGRNLVAHLARRDDLEVIECDRGTSPDVLADSLSRADVVFHLAGVNRPLHPDDFEVGNAGLTREICRMLSASGRRPRIVFSSSIQACSDSPYGLSKRQAEVALGEFAMETGAEVAIYRLKNVFGKWCRPNYNSVVATFCHNIAHDTPVQVNDPGRFIELIYIDDLMAAFLEEADGHPPTRDGLFVKADAIPSTTLTLGDLAGRIMSFHEMQPSLRVPDFSDPFNRRLYATYLSYVEPARWEYELAVKSDARGNLAEFIKSPWFGQVFVSRTRPGVTRGNHYHHTKTEKFFVIAGEGLIRFRPIEGSQIIEFRVRGEDYRVVEIPPGFTHSITNVGTTEMITLFWASEVFDQDHPDTHFLAVDPGESP